METLRISNLTHTYAQPGLDKRTVLTIDSWGLNAGTQLLLRGISGSGKTTLMNILAGLMQPTTGEVHIGEQSLYALSEAARDRFRAQQIGYIFQTHLLAPHLTALENVEMALAFGQRLDAKTRRQRASELLAKVGLADHLKNRPAQLSTGQRLRVAVARALVVEPTILLADEPTASLDADSGKMVMDLLQAYCETQKATLIVASHDPALGSRFTQAVDLGSGVLQPVEDKHTQ